MAQLRQNLSCVNLALPKGCLLPMMMPPPSKKAGLSPPRAQRKAREATAGVGASLHETSRKTMLSSSPSENGGADKRLIGAFPGGGMRRTHCLLSAWRFERGDNWCRAWWGAPEKAFSKEGNLRLRRPGGGGFHPPPAASPSWRHLNGAELEGEAPPLHNATQCCFSLGAPSRPWAHSVLL